MKTIDPVSVRQATNLCFLDIERSRFQFSISGPNSRCLWIQRFHFGEPFAKHQPLSKIKGVVGNSGKKSPAKPRPKLMKPTESSKIRTILFTR